MRSSLMRWVLLLGMVLAAPVALADWGALNMPRGVTEVSDSVYGLHMRIFYICCAIGAVVFGVMIVSMVLHRKSRGAKAADFHESTTVEVVWTVIPLVILIAMAIPAARVLIKMEDFSESDMSIKVTGYQWRWRYDYLDEGFGFYSQLKPEHNAARQKGSGVDLAEAFPGTDLAALNGEEEVYLREVDNELIVPVGRKIRFLHTAADVLHSWWVPDLAVKKDAVPGFINENWALIEEPGIYRGKCAELCGRDHGFMPIVVRAVPEAEYDAWVAEQQELQAARVSETQKVLAQNELMEHGEQVYRGSCMSCHQAEGQGIPGMFPPIAGSDIVQGDIDTHLRTVLDGVSGTMMSSYSNILDNRDIAAVITYQRNAFGNTTGELVQPADVASARQGLAVDSEVAALPASQFESGVN